MKIKVADLEPNPYREMGKYPIDNAKVNALRLSIRETTFWDNLLIRPHPLKKGKYQISYGHHRLKAVKEEGITEIDAPVRNLTDAQMIRIMAEENLAWLSTPAVIIQTVISVRRFLDAELAKYETWEELSNRFIRQLFESEASWRNTKSKGVGQTTILKFLGGNWKQSQIQFALKTDDLVKEKKLDREAVEQFKILEQAKHFQKAVVDLDIPIEKQADIVEKLKKNIVEGKTATTLHTKAKMSFAEDVRKQMGKPKTKKAKKNEVDRIIKSLKTVEKKSRELADVLEGLRQSIERLGVIEMQGLEPALAKFALKRLNKEMSIWRMKYGKNNRDSRVMQHALR